MTKQSNIWNFSPKSLGRDGSDMPNVNDDRPGVNGMEVTATRGGGNQTAAERVADLLTSDHDGAFKKEEAASRAARTQWTPAGAEYGGTHTASPTLDSFLASYR